LFFVVAHDISFCSGYVYLYRDNARKIFPEQPKVNLWHNETKERWQGFPVAKQPKHVRVVDGKPILVNPEMPPAKTGTLPPVSKSTSGAALSALLEPEELREEYHIADVQEWGIHIDFVSDDDGGGVVFLTDAYMPTRPSVLDVAAEETLENDLTELAKNAGLGGVEIIGNRLQWVKVYDKEGHPIGQDGYVTEDELVALDVFHDNLSHYAAPDNEGGRDA
jgi:hypothetical protein